MGDHEADWIAGLDILFVTGTGNSCATDSCGGRLWFPENDWWADKPDRWDNLFRSFATGKFIIARYAQKDDSGNIVAAADNTDLCGHTMEYCYSVLENPRLEGVSASRAAVRLGGIAFYLFQLWDTPAEVVETLNVCAEDVGAPGPDEEFGRGIVSLVCDRVQTREVRTAVESLSSYGVSPVVGQMLTDGQPRFYPPTSVSVSLPLNLKPFVSFDRYRMAGHLGAGFTVKRTDLYLAGGSDYAPLGLRSSLIPVDRSPFVEVGAKRGLAGGLSALGTYGHSAGDYVTANVVNVALRYARPVAGATLSVHAGYRGVLGLMGIPGYREAGAAKVRFTTGHPEVRFSVTLP